VVSLACAACAGSGAGAGGRRADIRQDGLVGTWGNASGARLELTADHKASAYGLDHALPLWPGCSPAIGEGGWAFYEPTGDPESYFASDDAAHGQSLWLGAGGDEECDLVADVRRDGRGFDLCLVSDPDQTCTSRELLRKVPRTALEL
jgi:hypothetical protein